MAGSDTPRTSSESPVQITLTEPLITETPQHRSPSSVRNSFGVMMLCFSLNHACVTTVIALATTALGAKLGGYSLGTLYLCFTLCALVGATGVVQTLGQKGALVSGAAAYCFYVAAFLVAASWKDYDSVRWTAALLGSVVGGSAAGWLWTAQGAYLTSSVAAYVKAQEEEGMTATYGTTSTEAVAQNGGTKLEASALFAGYFSTAYLGLEVGTKLLSFVLLSIPDGELIAFATFTSLAIAATVGLLFRTDLEEPPITGQETSKAVPCGGALDAVRLLFSDIKMPLMYPVQMAFGFTSSFLTFYVTKEVIDEYLGEAAISLLAAVIAGTGAALAMPASWVAGRAGKTPVMVLGIVCFIIVTVTFTVCSPRTLGHWTAMVPIYMVYGFARCVFEGQNKAVMADFFADHGSAWGANQIVASGGSSALGFFLFPFLNKFQMSAICCATSCVALVTYLIAGVIHRSSQDAKALAASVDVVA